MWFAYTTVQGLTRIYTFYFWTDGTDIVGTLTCAMQER